MGAPLVARPPPGRFEGRRHRFREAGPALLHREAEPRRELGVAVDERLQPVHPGHHHLDLGRRAHAGAPNSWVTTSAASAGASTSRPMPRPSTVMAKRKKRAAGVFGRDQHGPARRRRRRRRARPGRRRGQGQPAAGRWRAVAASRRPDPAARRGPACTPPADAGSRAVEAGAPVVAGTVDRVYAEPGAADRSSAVNTAARQAVAGCRRAWSSPIGAAGAGPVRTGRRATGRRARDLLQGAPELLGPGDEGQPVRVSSS